MASYTIRICSASFCFFGGSIFICHAWHKVLSAHACPENETKLEITTMCQNFRSGHCGAVLHRPGVEEMAARELTRTRELQDARRKRLIPFRAAIVSKICNTFSIRNTFYSSLFLWLKLSWLERNGELNKTLLLSCHSHRYTALFVLEATKHSQ